MLENKQSYIANFNCTFGNDNKPMLEYFFEILLPAFTSEELNSSHKENKPFESKPDFFFENVKLTNLKGDFVLAGLIVKRTTLEIRSRVIDGKLVKTNETYPSDPYSFFIINLKNHRMVLVKNQKGSPTLANFSVTAREKIRAFIRQENATRTKEERLPQVQLNVVSIPFKGAIKEELKRVKKIKKVTLKFYPLNGDIMGNETADYLIKALDPIGSKSGNVQFNSPTEPENVATMIEDTKGLMKPTINVELKNGTKMTLKDDSFTEVIGIPLDDEENFNQNIDQITGKVINKDEFTETSEENKSVYDRLFTRLENFYRSLF
ncbi:hypothetical protein [Bacillus subtilis]|uniref:hypothetical protein n=1 Tax=Bacillus subtilis TaxID=1423 RepID=UPI0022B7629B|nr:hypothetical protein [Bacillus subtilis]WBC26250.1 hypothetical protein O6U12_01800 [Bacillus subtilis]